MKMLPPQIAPAVLKVLNRSSGRTPQPPTDPKEGDRFTDGVEYTWVRATDVRLARAVRKAVEEGCAVDPPDSIGRAGAVRIAAEAVERATTILDSWHHQDGTFSRNDLEEVPGGVVGDLFEKLVEEENR